MSWKDDLQRVTFTIDGKERRLIGASFRGVPFFVEESERQGGRRVVTHEFPLRDDPFREDLGRKARTFRVVGYVLGDDYLSQRDALLAALEDVEGPGQLLHPYYGAKSAICEDMNVRETKEEGRIAKFTIEFGETPAQAPTPSADVDAASQVSDAADAADAANDASFASKFKSSIPSFALESAITGLSNATDAVDKALGPFITATQEAALFNSQLTLIKDEAQSLVEDPSFILGKFHTALAALANTVANSPGDVFNAMLDAYGFDPGPTVAATTATRATELANQQALTSALQQVFAIQAARVAPLVQFASTDDAIAARDQLISIFDTLVSAADDTTYPTLVDLRSQVGQALPGDSVFPDVVTVTRSYAVPSLLLAYQLYGAVDNEPDIVARNNIRHPGFVFGDLKVLSNG